MPIVYDSKYVEHIAELGQEMLADIVTGVEHIIGSTALDMTTPSPEELAAFFFHQNALYPPQPYVYPDGRVVTASPWVLMLEFCENGDEWLRRFTSFMQRENGGA